MSSSVIDDVLSSTITLNSGTTASTTYSSAGIGGSNSTYIWNGGSAYPPGSILTTTGTGSTWTTAPAYTIGTTTSTPSIQVKGDAEFEGRVKINGQDLADFMETMSKRLAILVPDPKKLEKFEALQKAYNHYKMLEALCMDEDNEQKAS